MTRVLFFLVVVNLIFKNYAGPVNDETPLEKEKLEEKESPSLLNQFESFIKTHNKEYKHDKEKERRFKIFQDNLKQIEFLRRNERGTATYGVTEFADLTDTTQDITMKDQCSIFFRYLTDKVKERATVIKHSKTGNGKNLAELLPQEREEFNQKYANIQPSSWNNLADEIFIDEKANSTLSETAFNNKRSINWGESKYSGVIKNQHTCGGCYAFASVSLLEHLYSNKNHQRYIFSPQYILDCTQDEGNRGCNGGFLEYTLRHMVKVGVPEDIYYPFENEDSICRFPYPEENELDMFQLKEAFRILDGEKRMLEVLPESPIVIGMNAKTLQFYKGGISSPSDEACPRGKDFATHAMLVVGSGNEDGRDYFIVQNSWGMLWGEKGYIRFAANENICGIGNFPHYGKI